MWVLDCQMTCRSEMLQLQKKRYMIATKIAEHFNFTLQALSFPLRILTDADLIAEKKQEKDRLYPVKRRRFLVDIYDCNLKSLKKYVENKEKK
jgi:DNA-binding transcriptional ArsR family regulator